MSGEIEEGRRIIRRARATFAEFGLMLMALGTARDEALIERYAGDPAAVERVLRPSSDELRRAGDVGSLSIQAGELADALYELGRFDEAEDAAREGEHLASEADVASQVVWRRVRAKLVARRGEGDEARRLVHEAIALAETSADLEPLGDSYRDLAAVERFGGFDVGATRALEQALAAYEQKGLVPMINRTRGELAARPA